VAAAATDDGEVSGTSRATAKATSAVATEAIEAFEVVRILWFMVCLSLSVEVGLGEVGFVS